MFTRSVLLTAAALSMVSAQDNSTCSTFLNATSQADLDKISRCTTFDESITIAGDAGVLTLNGVQNITGSLKVIGASDLTSLSAPQLSTIDGSLHLQELTVLNTLAMPKLANLGAIRLITLPALEELQFNTGVENAKNILISDTSLKSLEGLNLSSVDNFEINNNKNIQEISVSASQISQTLDVSFNAAKVNVSFPNLKWVNNATFRYCSSVDMQKLEKVNNSLSFVNNTIYGIDLDHLASVGSLTISSNSELRNVSFANLSTIDGGFVIANNSRLHGIYGFPKLKKVTGTVDFEGNLTTASIPKLEEVDGGVYIDSSGVFNCSVFNSAKDNGDIRGDKYFCKGASTTISTTLSSATATGSSSSGNSKSSGSASATGTESSSSKSKSKNEGVALSVGGSGIIGVLVATLFQFL